MDAAKIKQHAIEWRCLGDILIKHDFLYAEMKRSRDPKSPDEIKRLLLLAAAAKRRRKEAKGKDKIKEEEEEEEEEESRKIKEEEEEKRFFIFSEDFMSNLMTLPTDAQLLILEYLLMPRFLDKSNGNKARLVQAVQETRKLDLIFTFFVKQGLKSTEKDWLLVLLSEYLKTHMYTAWIQHPTSSFSVWNQTFHGEPFSEAEFRELRLVELIKMNRLNPHLWYRSFLANVLFNWYITELTYSVFSYQMRVANDYGNHYNIERMFPELTEKARWKHIWTIAYNQDPMNLLGMKIHRRNYNPNVFSDVPRVWGSQTIPKFLLDPWESHVTHLPYEAVETAFMITIASVLGYVTLIRLPSILWNPDEFMVLEGEPDEKIKGEPMTPSVESPTYIKPFIVFDPPVKAYNDSLTTSGLLYAIGQMATRTDQHMWFDGVRLLSTYNATRALSMFHATASIRHRSIRFMRSFRMKNDRLGPLIVIPPTEEDYKDNNEREDVDFVNWPQESSYEEASPYGYVVRTEPPIHYDATAFKRTYKGIIREEAFESLKYQKAEDFEDITEKDGNVPKWLRLVLREPDPEPEKKEEEEEEETDMERHMREEDEQTLERAREWAGRRRKWKREAKKKEEETDAERQTRKEAAIQAYKAAVKAAKQFIVTEIKLLFENFPNATKFKIEMNDFSDKLAGKLLNEFILGELWKAALAAGATEENLGTSPTMVYRNGIAAIQQSIKKKKGEEGMSSSSTTTSKIAIPLFWN